MKLTFLVVSAVALLTVTSSFAADCIPNTLQGHESFCLTVYEKDVKLGVGACAGAVNMLHADHLKFQCAPGTKQASREWEVWCWGTPRRCNISQYALCTYKSSDMHGALEKEPGEHCTTD